MPPQKQAEEGQNGGHIHVGIAILETCVHMTYRYQAQPCPNWDSFWRRVGAMHAAMGLNATGVINLGVAIMMQNPNNNN